MSVFRITGGRKLCGDLYPQGAKNEALQVLSAVLLTKEPVIIRNIPKIRDVMNLIELLMCLGVKVTQIKSNEYRFQADDVNIDYLTSPEFQEKSKTLRGSIMLVGP
ncbi:MAG: UDP-N-acetylglucosamine 1-carboxyvinyltransferase, partial [Bacteroidales bacterium]|nr:UDP-N-acetylglucosamine 1-carboxyvinyltransferase [Bacteroidales bacterium]